MEGYLGIGRATVHSGAFWAAGSSASYVFWCAMAWCHDVVAMVLVCEAVVLGLCGFDGGVPSAFGVDYYQDLGASRSALAFFLWPVVVVLGCCHGFGLSQCCHHSCVTMLSLRLVVLTWVFCLKFRGIARVERAIVWSTRVVGRLATVDSAFGVIGRPVVPKVLRFSWVCPGLCLMGLRVVVRICVCHTGTQFFMAADCRAFCVLGALPRF